VDGVPVMAKRDSELYQHLIIQMVKEMGSGQNIGSISDISPDDIESIRNIKRCIIRICVHESRVLV